jgi:hypothetical protein
MTIKAVCPSAFGDSTLAPAFSNLSMIPTSPLMAASDIGVEP